LTNQHLPFDDSSWELPSHTENIYTHRNHRYALVIPVINEGDRIRQQLRNIQDNTLPVDVIVADGGSTDGSLEDEHVRATGITAVLIKKGPGKLSAQLRMAYAWCIRQGYEGIVTIDGNGKDGVEAVNDMISLLDENFDYVQGSRYLQGGKAENTPLERTIGNRLIHAPMLSLSGRHWLTDTTNGFRAYSRRYLLDSRVKPFRRTFNNYELLFYLSVRAGQLGFKVCETPVRRSYPKDGATPTKIQSFSEKIDILKQLFRVATGGYNP